MTYLEGSEDNDYNSEVAISDPEENSEEIALPIAELVCSVCEEYFDSENKLERHKLGMSFNLLEISTEF